MLLLIVPSMDVFRCLYIATNIAKTLTKVPVFFAEFTLFLDSLLFFIEHTEAVVPVFL